MQSHNGGLVHGNDTYIGLDVHKDTISVAVAETGRDPARLFTDIPNDFERLLKTLKRLASRRSDDENEAQLIICYEAGPTGYGLYRQLRDAGSRSGLRCYWFFILSC